MKSQEDTAVILRERAKVLSREPERPRDTDAEIEVVVFRLAEEQYAIESKYVAEIRPLEDLTRIPGTPSFIAGIVTLRGRILTIIDIKSFFELPEIGISDSHRIFIIHHDDIQVGILADVVIGLQNIPVDAIERSLPTLTGIRGDYLVGVTGEHLIVLDAVRILCDNRIIINDEGEL